MMMLEKGILQECDMLDINDFISTLILLPKEDRAILLSNANALRIRNELEKIRNADKTVS